jgi:hypothetical protein
MVSAVVWILLNALINQERAVANARAAATALSGRLVERHEVELFFEELESARAAGEAEPREALHS